MVRTAVYGQATSRTETDVVETEGASSGDQKKDQFSDKLVKYIPAEVIAFFLPAYALVESFRKPTGGSEGLFWLPYILVAVGIFGVVGYLLIRAPKDNPPRAYFYFLAALAFLAWAAGTSAAGSDVFHLPKPEVSGKLLVMGAVFLIPLVDELLTRFLPSRN